MQAFKHLKRKSAKPATEIEAFASGTARGQVVTFESSELTALCPVTKQPDFYMISIMYEVLDKCIESKSLKLYLWSYRNARLFGEALAAKVAADVMAVAQAKWVTVTLRQSVRGGLTMTVTSRIQGSSPRPAETKGEKQ